MSIKARSLVLLVAIVASCVTVSSGHAETLYLVSGTGGPGFTSPEQEATVLEHVILPGFDVLLKAQKAGEILAGGLPLGDRALIFIMAAESNAAVDRFLRELPFWSVLQWEVTALQTFEGRAAQERNIVDAFKKGQS